jgi:methionine sulfoxide reductase heme-binding subunit
MRAWTSRPIISGLLARLGDLNKARTRQVPALGVHTEASPRVRTAIGTRARALLVKHFQLLVHIGALLPLANLLWDAWNNDLTVNPIQAATLRTGKTALILLILTLSATPLNTLFGFRPALKARRTLGLYTFLYVSIHLYIFVGLDYVLDPQLIKEAIFEKRYALVGFSAFLLLLPLAVTSFKWWQKKLGRTWTRLHRLIYPAALLVIIHYVWLVKSDIRVPLAYGAIVTLLLILRIPRVRKAASALRQNLQNRLRTRALDKSP